MTFYEGYKKDRAQIRMTLKRYREFQREQEHKQHIFFSRKYNPKYNKRKKRKCKK